MIAKFSNRGKEYTLDSKKYVVVELLPNFRFYVLKGDNLEKHIKARNIREVKEKLERNGFVFEGFVVEGNAQ